MNKTNAIPQNSPDGATKEASNSLKKSGLFKDASSEAHSDDNDKAQPHQQKNSSHFDYSNLSVFFTGKPSQPKPQNPPSAEGVIGKGSCKQKSNERSSSKEGNLNKPSSRDFSNLKELMENTTIIRALPEGNSQSQQSQQGANETGPKDVNDNLQPNSLENSLVRTDTKNKSKDRASRNSSKTAKEDKVAAEQEIASDIYKLGMNTEEDQDKCEFPRFRDFKMAKTTKLTVFERLKTKSKVIPHRVQGSNEEVGPFGNNRIGLNLNNSVDSGSNTMSSRMTKAVSPIILHYQDRDLYGDDNSHQHRYIAEIFRNSRESANSEDIPLDKSKEISQEDLLPRLLTEKSANKPKTKPLDLNLDSTKVIRRKANLSLVSTDSTVDSEGLTLVHEPQNNSFSTPFSAVNGSFQNSGSPSKTDSGRIHSERSDYIQGYPMQIDPRMATMNSQQRAVHLNQNYMSYCGGYGSGPNSDRSTNLSFNEEYLNNFNTPQANQQQNFMNQSFNMSSRPGMMEQFFIAPQQGMMNQNITQQQDKMDNFGAKNSRIKRKGNQEPEDESYFEINPEKIVDSGRTTLMVKNIPNKYDLTLILQTIDKNYKGKFDFFYLPIDFSNRCNFGYAFINFMDTKYIRDFYFEFNGKKWEKFNSEKICEIRYARIQGYQALMQHFQYSRVMNQQDKKLRPYIPPNYAIQNKQKIEELVRQQKLASSKEMSSIRQYK